MYRVNYRIYKGVIFGNQKLYKQGSVVSATKMSVGQTFTVLSEGSPERAEVTQTVLTNNYSV